MDQSIPLKIRKESVIMFDNEPDLLTRKECQELLHISKSKLLDLIHGGRIPARKILGSFRIEKDDLIDFVKNTDYFK